ncbi:hypothetical protein MSAR_34540 [Mycolicibacterium sarraceniae]|uniref:Uncharacterized protein n=1 Tax=Mycolicibacterium sarraceniae TaxID=1534348 RepID=A0A7I7SU57_9MYCO|nr:hypothetical protein MSAR_34540 [Mycolicibacterium sarraceniae]
MANYGGRCRSGKHIIRKSSDLRVNGACAECSRTAQRAYRRRCREAYAALRAATADTA